MHKLNVSIKEIFVENITRLIDLNGYLPLPHSFFFFSLKGLLYLMGKKSSNFCIFASILWPCSVRSAEQSAMDGGRGKPPPVKRNAVTPLLLLSKASGNAPLRSWVLH